MCSEFAGRGGLSRRALLGGGAGVGAVAVMPAWPAAAAGARGDRRCGGFRVSLSVSPVTEAVLGSVSLTDGRRTASTVGHAAHILVPDGNLLNLTRWL